MVTRVILVAAYVVAIYFVMAVSQRNTCQEVEQVKTYIRGAIARGEASYYRKHPAQRHDGKLSDEERELAQLRADFAPRRCGIAPWPHP